MRLNPVWVMVPTSHLKPLGLEQLNVLMKKIYSNHVILLNVY